MEGKTEVSVTMIVFRKRKETLIRCWELYVPFHVVMLVRSDLSAYTLRGLPSSECCGQDLPRSQVRHPAAKSTAYVPPVAPPWMVHRGASVRKVCGCGASKSTVRFERRCLFFTSNRRPGSTTTSQPACTPSSPVVHRVLVPLLDSRTHGPSRDRVRR